MIRTLTPSALTVIGQYGEEALGRDAELRAAQKRGQEERAAASRARQTLASGLEADQAVTEGRLGRLSTDLEETLEKIKVPTAQRGPLKERIKTVIGEVSGMNVWRGEWRGVKVLTRLASHAFCTDGSQVDPAGATAEDGSGGDQVAP